MEKQMLYYTISLCTSVLMRQPFLYGYDLQKQVFFVQDYQAETAELLKVQ